MPTTLDICSKSCTEWRSIIDDWCYNEKHRAVVKDRLLNGLTYEALAERHELSVSQVKRIVKTEVDNLINHI